MSQLGINEPIEKDEDDKAEGSYQPTPEEQARIKYVNKAFEDAKEARKQFDDKFLDYYHYFRGKQWKGNRPSYRHSEVLNLIWQHVQHNVAIETDSRPRFDYIGSEPSDIEFAEILSEIAFADWDKYGWLLKLTEIYYDKNIYGTGFSETGYDPDAKYGQGAITFNSRDPFYMFPENGAESFKDKCDQVSYAEPVSVKRLKREYPKVKEFIKADLIDLMKESKLDLNHPKYRSPTDNTVMDTSGHDVASKDKSLKITLYERCFETEEVNEPITEEQPVVDPLTGQPMLEPVLDEMGQVIGEQPVMQQVQIDNFVTRLKYPNGRKTVIASGVLLEDGPYPFEDDGDFHPFSRFVNFADPRSFWGISEEESLISPQNMFNKIVSYMLDIFVTTGNPVWVVDESSNVDEENIVNRPGLVITKAQGSEVTRMPGMDINPSLFQLVDRVRNWFNEQSMDQDVSRGAKPEGITAASAITALQEAAQTISRLKSRNNDDGLQSAGQKYRNRVMQFMSAPRAYRITNKQGVEKYFKMHVETSDDGQKKAVVRDFNQGENGQYSEALETREFVIRGDLDVKTTTGSSLPFAKTEKANLAFQLFDRQAIDQEELLNATDYPNKERVMQRMAEKAQMAAQEQAMMQAQGAGPVPEQVPTGQPV